MKKTFIIALCFCIITLCIAVYLIFFRDNTTQEGTSNTDGAPFGLLSGNRTPDASSGGGGRSTNERTHITINTLTKLSAEPVAGAHSIRVGSSTVVQFNEKAAGHIYEINLSTGTTSKISNTTIPKIVESFWFSNGRNVLLRYLAADTTSITTYAAELVAPQATSTSSSVLYEIKGVFLPAHTTSIALSPDKTRAFIITENTTTEGMITDATGATRTSLFTSAIHEWITTWPEASTIALTTKASRGVPGYLYFLTTQSGALRKILGSISGLTTLTNPSAALVAFSDDTNNLQVYTIRTNTVSPTNLRTLAEKCIWSQRFPTILYCAVPSYLPSGAYPDAWYQGAVTFTDSIYKIDTTQGQYTLIANLADFQADIDGINLSLSPSEDFLLITNKKDYSLWSLKLPF